MESINLVIKNINSKNNTTAKLDYSFRFFKNILRFFIMFSIVMKILYAQFNNNQIKITVIIIIIYNSNLITHTGMYKASSIINR